MARFVIEGGAPLNGVIRPSGNKNEALPALMACLLTDEDLVLHRVPRIRDVLTVCDILVDLGVTVEWIGSNSVLLNASKATSYTPDSELCSRVRASILFMGPLLSRFQRLCLPLPGGDVIGARRVDSHFEGIEALGANLKFGHPITGAIDKIRGAEIFLDEPSVTATENLLLLAVRCEGQTTIHNAACEPHVAGLCRMLNAMGGRISGTGTNRLIIEGVERLHGAEYTIGPDFMEVGSFLCLGAIGGGKLRVEGVELADLRFVLKTLARIGIETHVAEDGVLEVDGTGGPMSMDTDISGRIGSIYSGPWPAFPTDLMSVALVAATQARGTMIFHEKMHDGRMFFTDKLMAMGANIVLCDPHRVVVTGPEPLLGSRMTSPDVRAGMAMLMAAVIANGTSEIDHIHQIERGYEAVDEKLRALGAQIQRLD